MPFTVKDIIDDNPTLVTAKPGDPVMSALSKMIEYDFSQLPIIDLDNKPLGLITAESILRAHTSFDTGLDQLRVEHARIKADIYRSDSDLFDLLNRLQDTYAVLIVDGQGCLTGIVTNYDTAEYFRRRAEDMMVIEDIESLLKDYIQAAYRDDQGEIDEERLAEAIQRISDSRMAKQFEDALIHYLTLQGGKIDKASLQQVLAQHYQTQRPDKDFEDLTLNEYAELLLDKEGWGNYQPVFNLDIQPLRTLLNRVRIIRNALAHFRGEITSDQRNHLRFSANWLAQYEDVINRAFEVVPGQQPEVIVEVGDEPDPGSDVEADIIPTEDEADPNESRYAPLAIWLQSQPPRKSIVKPTFAKIEEIIGGLLPESAYMHRAWWANDSVSHVQSQQWLEVGWRVSSINMSSRVVRFTRIKERQKAYIDFFSKLLHDLSHEPGFKKINKSSQGNSWHVVEYISVKGNGLGSFVYSFGRGKIFRIELYLGQGSQEFNKALFDGIQADREEIEQALGKSLLWQRLNSKRASRIAIIYEDKEITDNEDDLAELRQAAVPDMVSFRKILLPRVLELSKGLMSIHPVKE